MYIVGIDLGTTHCAVASVDTRRGADAEVVDFPVPQLVRPGEVAPRALLPSCIYLPSDAELPDAALKLPWSAEGERRICRLRSTAWLMTCTSGMTRSPQPISARMIAAWVIDA